MAIQIRRLTPNEKTSQVSAYGGLAVCDQAECSEPAEYLAIAFIQRMKLCEGHKSALEASMEKEETS